MTKCDLCEKESQELKTRDYYASITYGKSRVKWHTATLCPDCYDKSLVPLIEKELKKITEVI
jgi:hypothetical protein